MDPSTRRIRWLARVGIAGPVVWWLLVAVNGAITPGYSHVGDFISALGAVGAPYATLQRLNFLLFGAAILALTAGIHAWLGDGRRPRPATVLVGVFGAGVALAAVFPMDLVTPGSLTDTLHTRVSMVAFLAAITGVSLLTRRLAGDDRWPTSPHEAAVTAAVVSGTFVLAVATVIVASPVLGLTQRLFLGVLSLWVVGQSLRLSRVAGDHRRG